jgi:hypothetical protein
MNVIKRIKLYNNTQNIRNNQEQYSKGAEILEKSFWRIAHDDVLISLSFKFRAIILRKFIAIILKIRNKNSKERLKKYLKRWKNLSASKEIKTKLKIIFLRYHNNRVKQLSKYFNKWKFKKPNRPKFKNEAEMHNKFGSLLNKWTKKYTENNKKDLINNLCIYYINKQGQKFSKLKLRKLFKQYAFKKIRQSLRPFIIKVKIEKLIITTIEERKNKKNNFLKSIIRKWRFITFVNNLTKKKLELMYKNLHMSYMEMADEVLNSRESLSSKELKQFFNTDYENNKFNIGTLTEAFLIKELGFDSETTFNKSFDRMSGSSMNNNSFKKKRNIDCYESRNKNKMKNNSDNSNNSINETNLSKKDNDEEPNSINNSFND